MIDQFLGGVEHEYIALACEHFNESYRDHRTAMSFLLLMIAMEVLLNDGQTELRYRTSRNAAVLAGRTASESGAVFKEMKRLYDLRSKLVHTGDMERVTDSDVLSARSICRRSIAELMFQRRSKVEIAQELTATGFGGWIAASRER